MISGGAFAWSAWEGRERSVDSSATYLPADASSGAPVPAGVAHLALRGRLLWQASVNRTKSGQSTGVEQYVPIVDHDWRGEQPVRFIARIEGGHRTVEPLARRLPDGRLEEPPPIRVRLDGAVPSAALPVFERMHLPLDRDVVLVGIVPAVDGQVARQGGIDWQGLRSRAILFNRLWLGLMLMVGGALLGQRRQARAAARRAQGS